LSARALRTVATVWNARPEPVVNLVGTTVQLACACSEVNMTATVFQLDLRMPNGRSIGAVTVSVENTVSGTDFRGQAITEPHLVGIGFASRGVAHPHWLQFIWKEVVITTDSGSFRAQAQMGNHNNTFGELTTNPTSNQTRRWALDSVPHPVSRTRMPWYDHGGLSFTNNDPSRCRILLDAPLNDPSSFTRAAMLSLIQEMRAAPRTPGSAHLSAAERVLTASATYHFDTYLVVNERNRWRIRYHLEWSASRSIHNPEGNASLPRPDEMMEAPASYSIGSHGAVTHLPTHLRAVLATTLPGWEHSLS
jgi:hypothetical protein